MVRDFPTPVSDARDEPIEECSAAVLQDLRPLLQLSSEWWLNARRSAELQWLMNIRKRVAARPHLGIGNPLWNGDKGPSLQIDMIYHAFDV
jgi:hypothetical protein